MPETTKGRYPEHEKLDEVRDASQAIGEFLDYGAADQGLVLCEQGRSSNRMVPTSRTIPSILARYFGIDEAELEREKRQMLADMRSSEAVGS